MCSRRGAPECIARPARNDAEHAPTIAPRVSTPATQREPMTERVLYRLNSNTGPAPTGGVRRVDEQTKTNRTHGAGRDGAGRARGPRQERDGICAPWLQHA